ncbi:MAG: helix-turn-helix domain-containing protein [Chloroflexi bacterium]|nr:helix-turn-helix domain-containing protein [Chloroflexota bacterium]
MQFTHEARGEFHALAAKLGVKRPDVTRLELGEHNPSIETIERPASVPSMTAPPPIPHSASHSSSVVRN